MALTVINLAQESSKWRLLMKTIMQVWVSENSGKLFTRWGTCSFFKNTLPPAVRDIYNFKIHCKHRPVALFTSLGLPLKKRFNSCNHTRNSWTGLQFWMRQIMATFQNDVVHYISASCLTNYKERGTIVINRYVCTTLCLNYTFKKKINTQCRIRGWSPDDVHMTLAAEN